MISFANAKINIGLNIIEKRADGFHNIESVFYPVSWNDIVEIIPLTEKKISFSSSGIDIPGNDSDNLILKAYNLIQQDFELPGASIHLHKIIPIGAGLGGGSSDAAHAIKILNDLFELKLKQEQMLTYAAQLGSDCSFFILNKPAFAFGKGEKLNPIELSLKEYSIAIIYPDIHISTAEAYAGIKPEKPLKPLTELIKFPIEEWKDTVFNDFEKSIFPKYPLLKNLKEKLYAKGAIYASMSGSGSAIYGIFKMKESVNFKMSEFGKYKINVT
jgi:4-diphosphocytidyl-2-C-methyl-D-erythritol kinase